MKFSGRSALNLSFILGFFVLCCAFQSTLWYQLVGKVPSPMLWVLVPLYILITRETFSALMIVYFLSFVASRFSAVPLGSLLPTMALLCGAVLTFRSRIFWRGSSYFFLVGSSGLILFHALFFLNSLIFEANSTGFLLIDRLTQVILSLGFIYPIFVVMKWIDRTFQYQEGFGTGDLI